MGNGTGANTTVFLLLLLLLLLLFLWRCREASARIVLHLSRNYANHFPHPDEARAALLTLLVELDVAVD